MARRLLAGVALTAALAAVGSAAAGRLPILRSVSVAGGHVVLGLSVGDLRPTELTVAKRGAVDANGALLARNVRMRETILLPATTSAVVRWQSRKALSPGVYFVQVTAVETGGVTDCPRFARTCNERWSSVRRVVVPTS